MNDIKPGMPKHLVGGRHWTRKASGGPGYSSDDGNYDIIQGNGYVVLVSMIHDPLPGDEFWRKRFPTVKEAMEHVEKM